MSKFKHTPGPWYAERYKGLVSNESLEIICQFFSRHEDDFRNSEANAKLIAAAPDMLEALESIQDILYSPGLIDAGNLRRIVDSAIKKATE